MRSNWQNLGAVCIGMVLWYSGCSELKKDLPAPVAPGVVVHERGWNDTSATNFHGKVLKAKGYHLSECTPCHAKSFQGGTSQVSCLTCHAPYPHIEGWKDPSATGSHGNYLKTAEWDLSLCQSCHGQQYDGGTSGVTCYECHGSYPHLAPWSDPASAKSHGNFLKQNQWDASSCQPCHGAAYDGGTSEVSCYTCHRSYPHNASWITPASPDGHGRYLKNNQWNLSDCQSCHGAQFDGGTSGVSCYTCHALYPHMAAWSDPSSLNSHGNFLKAKQWDASSCQACHGTLYDGGTTGVSCYTCHASYPHDVQFGTAGHPSYLQANGFPLVECQTCHGASYAGGAVVTVSCMTAGCHVDLNGTAKSPESCNTCHGVFSAPANDFLSSAPPKSVAGGTATTVPGVGAHQAHLTEGLLSKAVKCQECHQVPSQVSSPGHLGSGPPAEVVFTDILARLITGDGTLVPSPAYNASSLACGGTYCHGTWKLRKETSQWPFAYSDSVMVGLDFAPMWTGGSSQAACGTCHGLPPEGHNAATITGCGVCHASVVNSAGVIIDKTKHINGKINVFGSETDMK